MKIDFSNLDLSKKLDPLANAIGGDNKGSKQDTGLFADLLKGRGDGQALPEKNPPKMAYQSKEPQKPREVSAQVPERDTYSYNDDKEVKKESKETKKIETDNIQDDDQNDSKPKKDLTDTTNAQDNQTQEKPLSDSKWDQDRHESNEQNQNYIPNYQVAPAKKSGKADNHMDAPPIFTVENNRIYQIKDPQAAANNQHVPLATNPQNPGQVSEAPLRQLSKAYKAMGIIENVPAVAFVTGKLEFINPKEIPALVSSNPFITTMLGENNLADVMDTSLSIKKLFAALEISPQHMQVARNLGVNLEQMTTPRQFFMALGMNPQQVTTEMKLLKANLQLDGLTPYIQRAKALNKNTVSTNGHHPLQNRLQEAVQSGPRKIMNKKESYATQDPNLSPISDIEAFQSQKIRRDLNDRSFTPIQIKTPIQNTIPNTTFAPTEQQVDTQNPTMIKASIDPFEALSAKMALEGTKETVVSMEDIPLEESIPHESTNEIQTQEGGETLLSYDKMNTIKTARANKESTQETDLMTYMEEAIHQKASDAEGEPFTQKNTFVSKENPLTDIMNDALAKKALQPKTELNLEEASFNNQSSEKAAPIINLNLGSRSSGQDSSHNFSKQSSYEWSKIEELDKLSPHKNFSIKTEKVSYTPSINRLEVIERIMSQASLMIKEGGGAARVQIKAEGLGNLDIALNVLEQGIKMKILTSSDQVRDILMMEIPRMRDILESQNLKLENVEVGVTQGQDWKQSYSGNGQGYQKGGFSPYGDQKQSHSNNTSNSQNWQRSTARTRGQSHQGLIQVMA